MDLDFGEDLGWTFRLVGLDAHLITGDLLVVFLPKNGDHVEGSATSESNRKHLDWLGACSACRVVQEQMMAASSSGHKLALLPKRLSKFNFRCDHESLLQIHRQGTRINAESRNLLQEISEQSRDER
jgi:hypothetical protein